jgi:hypothetical protein
LGVLGWREPVADKGDWPGSWRVRWICAADSGRPDLPAMMLDSGWCRPVFH